MIIKKNILYIVGIFLVIVLMGSFAVSRGESAITGNPVFNGEAQLVKLSVQNGNYVLEPSEIQKGVPVRIEADMSTMAGCSRSIVIPAFGVSKTFSSNDNTVEFVPDKAGTFNIACSMNMYQGTFIVLESDGTASNYVEQKSNSGGSCGMDGGCGCGS